MAAANVQDRVKALAAARRAARGRRDRVYAGRRRVDGHRLLHGRRGLPRRRAAAGLRLPAAGLRPGRPDAATDLGSYPADFVTAVRDEGTGRTTDGRYLNWSVDVGFWLDTAPRDSGGGELRPWESAAADDLTAAPGSRSSTVDATTTSRDAVCTKLRDAHWTVRDEFTPGLGGSRHVDVYIGEETGPALHRFGLVRSPLHGARLDIA
jgi:hypothetical protein